MEQLNRSKLVVCPNCELTVLPAEDGTCPSCLRQITGVDAAQETEEMESDTFEIDAEEEVMEREPESSQQDEFEEEVLEEELAEDEIWLSPEPTYASYLHAAAIITRQFWNIVTASTSISVLFLGAFAYFGFKNIFSGETITAVIAFVIAFAMPAMLISFGIIQGNKTAEMEVSRLLMELSGFDRFYELYRPHLRNRFWKENGGEGTQELLMSLIRGKLQ
jgi:hypothetical protein